MKLTKGLFITGVLATTLLLSACTDPEGLKAENKSLKEQIVGLEGQVESLNNRLGGMTVQEVTPQTSLREVEGSDVPSFQTIEGVIKFPNALRVPNSADDVNNSYLMVGSRFKFFPSTNWLTRMDGATLRLSHPTKIWGSIKAVASKSPVPEADMQLLLQGFYDGFPSTTITYRKIFMDDRVVGMTSKAAITVDEKPYVVNAGFITRGEYGVLILFAYEDDNTGVQQELIDLLISSGTIGEARVKLE